MLAPDLGRALLRAWDDLASMLDEAELVRAITEGTLDSILTDDLFQLVLAESERVLFQQYAENLAHFGKDLGVVFGVLDPQVIDAARSINIKMAKTFGSDVRDYTQAFVENGLRDGWNPRRTARQLKKSLGLTENQLQWVRNFEDELRAGSKKALKRQLGRGFFKKPDGSLGYRPGHADGAGLSRDDMKMLRRKLVAGEGFTEAQITRMVDAYKRRLIAWHAESIARTATLDSLKSAQHESTAKAIREGILDATRMRSEWVTAGDSRVRDEHAAMGGQVVPFGQPFSNGQQIPGETDYNCRCVKRDFMARRQAA